MVFGEIILSKSKKPLIFGFGSQALKNKKTQGLFGFWVGHTSNNKNLEFLFVVETKKSTKNMEKTKKQVLMKNQRFFPRDCCLAFSSSFPDVCIC